MPDETISLGTCAQCGAYHGSWEPCPATCPKRCLNCGLLPVAHYLNSSGVLQCLNRVTKTLIGYNYRVDPAGACSCTRLPIFTRDGLCVRCGGDPSLRSDLLRAEGAAPGDDVDPVSGTRTESRSTPAAAVASAPLATDADAGGETTPLPDRFCSARTERIGGGWHQCVLRDGHAGNHHDAEKSAFWPSPATTGEGLEKIMALIGDYGHARLWDNDEELAAAYQSVHEAVASLLARVAQAEQDAARLDWLSGRMESCEDGVTAWTIIGLDPSHTSLRDAIDAARATPTTETDR